MLANYHTHTFRCNHASGSDREYVESAIEGGIKVLGFSDHCPFVFDDGFVSPIRMTPAETDGYFQSMEDLKKEYKNDITIYAGFESEYIPELVEAQDQFLKDYPVDYLIMGQHFLEREKTSVYTGRRTDSEEILKKYADLVIEGMKSGRYKYCAHPDLINFTGDASVYEFHMTRICEFLKENDFPVEINMLGYIECRHYPSEKFFEIAKKTGNKAIIGIDAHIPDYLAYSKAQQQTAYFAASYGLELVDYLPELGIK